MEKKTHPNLCNLWINYLKLKKEAYEKALVQAEHAVNSLNDSPDPDNDLLVVLFGLSRIMRDRDNT